MDRGQEERRRVGLEAGAQTHVQDEQEALEHYAREMRARLTPDPAGPEDLHGASDGTVPTRAVIGGLPANLDDKGFLACFAAYGSISRFKLCPPKHTGRRSALVELRSVADAQQLVDNLHGKVPNGLKTKITVECQPVKSTNDREPVLATSHGADTSHWDANTGEPLPAELAQAARAEEI